MLEHLTAKDIPGRYKELVDNIGIEGFKYLVQMHGGTLFYVPTLEMVNKLYRNRKIRESFRGDYNETAIGNPTLATRVCKLESIFYKTKS